MLRIFEEGGHRSQRISPCEGV